MLGGKAVEEFAVELGREARVDERGLDTVLGGQAVCHALAQLIEIAEREHGHIAALARHVVTGDAVVGILGRCQVGAAYQANARHANCHGMLAVIERPAQHGQIFLHAGRRQVTHVGKSTQHGNIKERKMRLGRGAKDRRAKYQDGRRGVVEAQVVPQLVIGALQKRAVHAKDRLGARAGERGGEGDGVLFGNTHVDKLLAGGSAELGRKAHDVGRGGRDAHDLRIALDGGAQGLARNVGIGARRGFARMTRAELAAGRHVKGAYVMPALGIALGWLKALALGGRDVQHNGVVDITQLLQRVDQGQHIVAGVQIAVVEPHGAEDIALGRSVAGA